MCVPVVLHFFYGSGIAVFYRAVEAFLGSMQN